MNILKMTIDDIPQCVRLLHEAFDSFKLYPLTFDDNHVAYELMIESSNRDSSAIVAKECGAILGCAVAVLGRSFFNKDHQKAITLCFQPKLTLSDREKVVVVKELFGALEIWAMSKNVESFNVGVPITNDMASFLEKRGYNEIERHFIKEVKRK